MNTRRQSRARWIAVIAAIALGTSVLSLSPAHAAKVSTVTVKASLPNGLRLLATAKSGKSFIATASGGKVTIAKIPVADTNAMTFSILNSTGSYVGPVMLKYSGAKNKSVKSLAAATRGFLAMKRATSSTVDLKKITVKSNFAHLAVAKSPIAVLSSSVAVKAGLPPARTNLGKSGTSTKSGLRKFADPTVNDAGADADGDGLVAFADVDDDNDGKIDLVDSTFYSTPVDDGDALNSDASIYTGLICGGQCVNLNAFGVTKPEDSADATKALKTMINTFQGVFFVYSNTAVTTNFPTRTSRTFGYFNIDCTGISWCSGDTSKAVTISPDFDAAGTQPKSNALPLTTGETDYKTFCGTNVIAKNPTKSEESPANWPKNDAGTGSAYDKFMDEWVFKTCDPDGDGFPNIIPSKGVLAGESSWVNEIKPRMSGADGMKVGDAIRFALTDSNKNVVASATQVISGVIQTAPSVRTWAGTSIHNANGSYVVPANMQEPTGSVTLSFWRPQRAPIGTEESWQDVGGLTYAMSGPGGPCPIASAKRSDGTSITVETKSVVGKSASAIVDTASDATPNAANYIEITVDTSKCSGNIGQWSISASDRASNSTHFKWQKTGNQPAPQNPNPNPLQNPNPNPPPS